MIGDHKSFWNELKDRKVARVAILYLVVSWGVVEVGSTMASILELPEWTPKLILVLIMLGFPGALVMAWAFELTSAGVQRARPSPTPSGHPLRWPFVAGLAVGIASVSAVAFVLGGGNGTGAPAGELDEDLVAVVPFQFSGPDELSYLGDRSFHTGEGRGEGWLDRVRGIFQEALDRDPTQGAAIMHLYFVDAVRGDIEDFRRSAIRMAAVDTTGWNGTQARVMLALTNPDTTGFGDTHATALERGVTFTYLTRFPGIVTEGWMVSEAEHGIEAYLAFGRPNEANEILSKYEETVGRFYHEMRLMDAARGALGEDLGLEAAQAHEQQLRGKAASDYTRDDLRSLVRLALWHLARGDTSRSDRTIGVLRTASSSATRVDSMSYEVASLFLEADLAERRGDSQAKAILVRMWPDYDAGVPLGPSVNSGMHFALAELYERLGEPEQALAILERETVFSVNLPQGAEYLRERGRLSALLGDTERAIREYRQYLLLRHNPEPELEQEVEAVRQALAALTGSP